MPRLAPAHDDESSPTAQQALEDELDRARIGGHLGRMRSRHGRGEQRVHLGLECALGGTRITQISGADGLERLGCMGVEVHGASERPTCGKDSLARLAAKSGQRLGRGIRSAQIGEPARAPAKQVNLIDRLG